MKRRITPIQLEGRSVVPREEYGVPGTVRRRFGKDYEEVLRLGEQDRDMDGFVDPREDVPDGIRESGENREIGFLSKDTGEETEPVGISKLGGSGHNNCVFEKYTGGWFYSDPTTLTQITSIRDPERYKTCWLEKVCIDAVKLGHIDSNGFLLGVYCLANELFVLAQLMEGKANLQRLQFNRNKRVYLSKVREVAKHGDFDDLIECLAGKRVNMPKVRVRFRVSNQWVQLVRGMEPPMETLITLAVHGIPYKVYL